MQIPDTPPYDVIIAGAGPVGLFLACELRIAGCSVLVLEKARHPHSPLKSQPFGLRGLSVPTIESFDRRGLLECLKAGAASRETPAGAHWMQQQRRPAGHFAGIQFFHDQIDATQWPHRLPGPIGSMAVEMASIEPVLAVRAEALGAEIRRGCGVEALRQSMDGVTVDTASETVHGRWLVGCDGGRSTVRKAAGIGFTGTDPEFTGYSVQVELVDPGSLEPGRHYTPTGMYTYAAPGTIAMVDFDGGAAHRSELERDHVEAVLRKVSGVDLTITALLLATTWTDRAYQATDYRAGRVLLAGDAAHIHSPLGGQGLNLGLGDAMNLGWKLAATIRGDAPAGLLDSYSTERYPVGAQILDWSRAQVGLMRPTRSSRALEAVVRDLVNTRDGATYFAERVWGVSLRYDLGGSHPLVGRIAPDFELGDGTRLSELLRTGKGLLLDFGARPSLQALARRWIGRISYVASEAKDELGLTALLVRPDGVVAWACELTPDNEEASRAAARWFGDPNAS
ncbi:FAD-dependent oxidoreductase [Bradyrhizobium sp. WBOS7]|uniref:FAD-dependent oxidoreductase n=1 Tax=Bradyrhizobium betae TaxID=244734 RepID=A0AAE9NBW4_9BRAD|nr:MULTISPECIES: FAD-dependent monooxygenase [Bradyrhizobium]MDD1573794.1 FAD-dependent oxidoreductase [Bradyrhizobium sp. WBOS1]UUO36312.1 FAD-dependent oxidoreductase [Bradyrhizobium sp. WBOS01]MDD1530327.1 FAD-dependent oxidoreductase [Bradyrhizobium sp. WBOS2]MDD1575246.1 FAD-dependent oxidoreductase [Bradyrhizobium sp. WBOS7]MDD1602837.1 FAD-dependent oxidoreductase [Bradyrhizobium sp. WBOS16]